MTSWWARWRLKSPASPLFTQPFIRVQIKETSKLRVTGLCAGNSPGTGEFPAQMASNAENVSIWWRHHAVRTNSPICFINSSWLSVTYSHHEKQLLFLLPPQGGAQENSVRPRWVNSVSPGRCIKYRKTSSISRTKFQNLNDSHLVLQLSLLNPLKFNVLSW